MYLSQMDKMAKNLGLGLSILAVISIGLYPLVYLLQDMSGGLLSAKPKALLENPIWQLGFYLHILLGGVALLTGWPQFIEQWRKKYLNVHRLLGRIYIISVFISGGAGLYIALYATGGISSILGFFTLAVLWLLFTIMAYITIKQKKIKFHQAWMIRSFALTLAAVTLRLWLPLFLFGFKMDFMVAYPIIAWLSWMPNLLVAELIICRINLPTKVL